MIMNTVVHSLDYHMLILILLIFDVELINFNLFYAIEMINHNGSSLAYDIYMYK